MTKWRQRVESKGMEKLLAETIKTGLKTNVLKRKSLRKINVDTTVQEKAITFPTDAKLYHKMREKLVDEAGKSNIELRQNYRRRSKQSLVMQGRYSHARQMRRAKKSVKKVKTYLGRVVRDIERKISGSSELKGRVIGKLRAFFDGGFYSCPDYISKSSCRNSCINQIRAKLFICLSAILPSDSP